MLTPRQVTELLTELRERADGLETPGSNLTLSRSPLHCGLRDTDRYRRDHPMHVRPTTDTAASAALSQTIDEVSAQASANCPARHSDHSRMLASTQPTPEMFRSLQRLARELGYETRVERIAFSRPGLELRGETQGWPINIIRLDSGLTPVQRFNTFCHEISHILLGHNPRNEREYSRMLREYHRSGHASLQEDPREEAACELAAAAMTRAAGLSNGSESAGFIHEKMRHAPVGQSTKDAANLAARILYAAVFEHQPAYAAA